MPPTLLQIDLVKAELAAAQALNAQLHEQLMDARKEVGAGGGRLSSGRKRTSAG
jgi:hypothetical protein